MRRNSKVQGFTLVEIIAVLVILGILAATAVPRYIALQDDAQRKAATAAVAEAQARINLTFAQFLLAGGECAGLDGASLITAYSKPTATSTTLNIADEGGATVGGWTITVTGDKVSTGTAGTFPSGITPPGGKTAIVISDSDEDKGSFRLYIPQCQ